MNDKDKCENAAQAQTVAGKDYARQATIVEIHQQQQKAHYEQADRHSRAVWFLKEHPEFVEFLELLKTGIFA